MSFEASNALMIFFLSSLLFWVNIFTMLSNEMWTELSFELKCELNCELKFEMNFENEVWN